MHSGYLEGWRSDNRPFQVSGSIDEYNKPWGMDNTKTRQLWDGKMKYSITFFVSMIVISSTCPTGAQTLLYDDFVNESTVGMATGVTFASGNAIFDLQSDGIEFDSSLIPVEGTVEVLLKIDVVGGGHDIARPDGFPVSTILDSVGADGRPPGSMWLAVGPEGNIGFSLGNFQDASSIRANNTSVLNGEFHAVAVSYGSEGMGLYFDGVQMDHKPFSGERRNAPLTLGDHRERHFSPNNYQFGFIGEVAEIRASTEQNDVTLLPRRPKNVLLSSKSLDGHSNGDNVFSDVGQFYVEVTVDDTHAHGTNFEFVNARTGRIVRTVTENNPSLTVAFGAALLTSSERLTASDDELMDRFDAEFVNPSVAAVGDLGSDFSAILDGALGTWNSGEYSGTLSLACDLEADALKADGVCDAADIDRLTLAVREETQAPTSAFALDLDFDSDVDNDDRRVWVNELAQTYFGDSNLDGEFNSTDFVEVFKRGEYEDGIDLNSGWADGDWNGDGDFGSGDLVLAFQERGFESGPRLDARAVPEPANLDQLILLLVGLVAFTYRRCR
ncbi:hypothetical protein ACFL2H_08730 [Planctomycetota bacterium]